MDFQAILDRAVEILSYLETEKIRELVLGLDRNGFLILGGATLLLVILCLVRRMVRTATLILAVCAVIILLHFTVPEPGQNIELDQLMGLFFGGTLIVALSLYFIFIRSD